MENVHVNQLDYTVMTTVPVALELSHAEAKCWGSDIYFYSVNGCKYTY